MQRKNDERYLRRWIPYSRQSIDEDDIRAVAEALRSDWVTTGPRIDDFENAFADWIGVRDAVAVSSGTAALHAAMYAAGIGPGDEVIVPAITFVATANSVAFQGGTPVLADVNPETILMDPADCEARITPRTKAIVTVDYAGQPCDYKVFRDISRRHNLTLIADACHSLGAEYKGVKTGTLADLTVFSLHPAKHITSGEGGVITTDDPYLAQKMRIFRNHGITSDHRRRTDDKTWHYEMIDLGYNYRITDFQCALAKSQMRKLKGWLARRRMIASCYDAAFREIPGISPLRVSRDLRHAYHLYVIRCSPDRPETDRGRIFSELREEGIGANVHYIPVHLHPYYRDTFGYRKGDYPAAESAYGQILSLPMFPDMEPAEVKYVIEAVRRAIDSGKRKAKPFVRGGTREAPAESCLAT